mmetsp:Transcript_949/g.2993  ORF Transcript_949/g.2993 Transcript_949/m.2993 type:complete len:334 (-) Transcript_949:581-1582(-)
MALNWRNASALAGLGALAITTFWVADLAYEHEGPAGDVARLVVPYEHPAERKKRERRDGWIGVVGLALFVTLIALVPKMMTSTDHLRAAVEAGDAAAARAALKDGADATATMQHLCDGLFQPFSWADSGGDAFWRLVIYPIALPVSAVYCTTREALSTPIIVQAAAVGNGDVVEQLLLAGADATASSVMHGPALIAAVSNSHAVAVRELLKHGADPDTSVWGRTALMRAAEAGDLAVVEVLLCGGAATATPAQAAWHRTTALDVAKQRGLRDVQRVIGDVERGGGARGQPWCSARHWAAPQCAGDQSPTTPPQPTTPAVSQWSAARWVAATAK